MQLQQLIEFLGNNPLLTFAFAGICLGLAWTFYAGRLQAGSSVSPMEAIRLIGHEEAVVVDVRGEGDFAGGHVVNSVNVPESALKDSTSRIDKHRGRSLIVVCGTGQRSAAVSASLRKQGFEKAVALHGGINAWQTAGLPLAKK